MLFKWQRKKSWWEALNNILAYSMQCLLCMKACMDSMWAEFPLLKYVSDGALSSRGCQSLTSKFRSDTMICLSRSMYVCVPFDGVLEHWHEATAVNVQHTHNVFWANMWLNSVTYQTLKQRARYCRSREWVNERL